MNFEIFLRNFLLLKEKLSVIQSYIHYNNTIINFFIFTNFTLIYFLLLYHKLKFIKFIKI